MYTEEKRQQFEVLLKQFDNTFHFADDQRAYLNGQKQLRELKALAVDIELQSEAFEKLTGHKL